MKSTYLFAALIFSIPTFSYAGTICVNNGSGAPVCRDSTDLNSEEPMPAFPNPVAPQVAGGSSQQAATAPLPKPEVNAADFAKTQAAAEKYIQARINKANTQLKSAELSDYQKSKIKESLKDMKSRLAVVKAANSVADLPGHSSSSDCFAKVNGSCVPKVGTPADAVVPEAKESRAIASSSGAGVDTHRSSNIFVAPSKGGGGHSTNSGEGNAMNPK